MKSTKEVLEEALKASTDGSYDFDEDDRLLKLVSADKTVSALGNVLNYIITDAFNLTSEESIFVSMLLKQALDPLRSVIPTAIMGAVSQEISNGAYSLRMFERSVQEPITSDLSYLENVKYASASAWTEGICQIIFASYPALRPTIASRIIGSIHGIFTEIGVQEDPRKSRLSAYLPNSIRYLLNTID